MQKNHKAFLACFALIAAICVAPALAQECAEVHLGATVRVTVVEDRASGSTSSRISGKIIALDDSVLVVRNFRNQGGIEILRQDIEKWERRTPGGELLQGVLTGAGIALVAGALTVAVDDDNSSGDWITDDLPWAGNPLRFVPIGAILGALASRRGGWEPIPQTSAELISKDITGQVDGIFIAFAF